MPQQSKLYAILTNDRNEKCILLTPEKLPKTPAINPEILYDGKKHALLYRSPNETIILDYIPPTQQKILKDLKSILVVEFNVKTKQPIHEYIAKITSTNKIPDIEKFITIKI